VETGTIPAMESSTGQEWAKKEIRVN